MLLVTYLQVKLLRVRYFPQQLVSLVQISPYMSVFASTISLSIREVSSSYSDVALKRPCKKANRILSWGQTCVCVPVLTHGDQPLHTCV